MKKFIKIMCAVMAVAMMATVFASCGDKKETKDDAKDNSKDTSAVKVIDIKLTDEEYVQAVKDRVHDYGKEGRYIAWYRENNPERREKGYETMYTESRKFYCD